MPVFLSFQINAQTISNVYNRTIFSLNGKWNYIIDPYETGYYDYRYEPYDKNPNPNGGYFLDRHAKSKTELLEYDFDKCPTLMVPGDWNSQDNKLLYYEGTIWYHRLFEYRKSSPDNRVFVYFGAANYEVDIIFTGQDIAHERSYYFKE